MMSPMTEHVELGEKVKIMDRATTVILWGREDVIGMGVERILKAQRDWNVIWIVGDDNFDVLIREVIKSHPDVVIIYQGDCGINSQAALALLDLCSNLRVITFNLESSVLEVFNRQKVQVREVSDLLDAV